MPLRSIMRLVWMNAHMLQIGMPASVVSAVLLARRGRTIGGGSREACWQSQKSPTARGFLLYRCGLTAWYQPCFEKSSFTSCWEGAPLPWWLNTQRHTGRVEQRLDTFSTFRHFRPGIFLSHSILVTPFSERDFNNAALTWATTSWPKLPPAERIELR